MKKQLVLKKNLNLIPKDVTLIFQQIKKLNKNALFATKNCIILNPINVYGLKSFFTINISPDSYDITIKKLLWKIPLYATNVVNEIHKIVKLNMPNYSVKIRDAVVTYMIPMLRIIGDDTLYYYRMHFHKIQKLTSSKKTSNRFIQLNGRLIKPIFKKNLGCSFISTSPILLASVHEDKHSNKVSMVIFKYLIDTKTGKITKAVLKALDHPTELFLLSNIEYKAANLRLNFITKAKENADDFKDDEIQK